MPFHLVIRDHPLRTRNCPRCSLFEDEIVYCEDCSLLETEGFRRESSNHIFHNDEQDTIPGSTGSAWEAAYFDCLSPEPSPSGPCEARSASLSRDNQTLTFAMKEIL